jgi:predicted DNA-binding WGR domain protein
MRSFTFIEGDSKKFWNIKRKGKSFTVTYGRLGSAGRTQTKVYEDAAKAKKEHDKLVQQKLDKGYVETTGSGKKK